MTSNTVGEVEIGEGEERDMSACGRCAVTWARHPHSSRGDGGDFFGPIVPLALLSLSLRLPICFSVVWSIDRSMRNEALGPPDTRSFEIQCKESTVLPCLLVILSNGVGAHKCARIQQDFGHFNQENCRSWV